eukprot:749319-Hanusia_phi.AAC.3
MSAVAGKIWDRGGWKEWKPCKMCKRPMTWRKSWEKNWDEVKYCSDKCRAQAKREKKVELTDETKDIVQL